MRRSWSAHRRSWRLEATLESDMECGRAYRVVFEFGPRLRRPEMAGTKFDSVAHRWIIQTSVSLNPVHLSINDRMRYGWVADVVSRDAANRLGEALG